MIVSPNNMKQSKFNIIKKAFTILSKEFCYLKANCKKHAAACWQCRIKLFMQDFECVIQDQQEMGELN